MTRTKSTTGTAFGGMEIASQTDYFTIYQHPDDRPAYEALHAVETALNLGRPYIPELYRIYATDSLGNNQYVELKAENPKKNVHPAFSRSRSLPWHVDALLEPIGVVNTTLLHCISPAVEGGETVVADISSIFLSLAEEHPEAAELLTQEHILAKRATLEGISAERIGPAFAYRPGCERPVITRYGQADTDVWRPRDFRENELLEIGLKVIEDMLEIPSSSTRVRLNAGQTLVLRNSSCVHRRTEYRDDQNAGRRLVRAMYTKEY
ncbi:TauD/TfdA family dioxygenase [Rhodococcus sp. 2G]|uniref:TauD/TfdA family dioxygenase n=1 Tax=Rhodococcus sp. 2G TaxID=1570939 RepID=UPI0009F85CAB|nr:TauD/TfdA family dioxygenase [Rhodococcus sp. 2G]